MEISIALHAEFEESLSAAFPAVPLPHVVWPDRYQFDVAAHNYLDGKSWPDIIGYKLFEGELGASLSLWMKYLPQDVLQHFLPGHLKLASLLLPGDVGLNYSGGVLEALVLPPGQDQSEWAALDDVLLPDAPLCEFAVYRRQLYLSMTSNQRQAISRFLDLYLRYRASDFTTEAMALLRRNSAFWRTSTLPG